MSQAVETRSEKIQSVAFRLFHQHGFRKVTMSDIAEAAGISRPTLYAVFSSKEDVLSAIGRAQMARGDAELSTKLLRAKSLEARLSLVFDVWIIGPAASVLDSPNGIDLLANAAVYAPAACSDMYARFEEHLRDILQQEMPKRRGMTARDLARIMMLATKGLKSSANSLAELRRMTDGLIAMAVATAAR